MLNEVLEKVEDRINGKREKRVPSLAIDLSLSDSNKRVLSFISSNTKARDVKVPLLPPTLGMHDQDIVLLNIPMDEETPSGRLLRPQEQSLEALLRGFGMCLTYCCHV